MTMIHHAGLCPADIDSSLRFYRDGVGLTVLADFTMDADLEPLLGEPRNTDRTRRGLFLLSFQVEVSEVLDRLAALGLGGPPRKMLTPKGKVIAVSVVDPDGVTVELLTGPMAQLPAG